jgi:Predicted nucleic-acid-binding protein containing a Zn-ribbon domain
MKLSQEQAVSIIERLNSTATHRQPCPICGNNNWKLNDKIWEIREFQGGSLIIGGDTSLMPLISVSCTNCGFTHFINAIRLGVVTPESHSQQEPKAPQDDSSNDTQ